MSQVFVYGCVSLWVRPLTQGVTQHPTAGKTLAALTGDVKTEATIPFHFPNHPSELSVKGSSMPEFSANSLAEVVSPCRALVTVLSVAVLLGIKVHFPPNTTQTLPFSSYIMSTLSWSPRPSCW